MCDRVGIKQDLISVFDEANILEQNVDGTFSLIQEIDSIQLISIIVEIEEKFNIEIPDEFLVFDFLYEIDHVVDVIEEIIHENQIS